MSSFTCLGPSVVVIHAVAVTHGFDASIRPNPGNGFVLFTSSIIINPGSPNLQAHLQISANSSIADIETDVALINLYPGFLRILLGRSGCPNHSHIHGLVSLDSTCCINASVSPTDMLKFSMSPSLSLQCMNSRISG